jgi:hypothetical protein
MNTKLETILKQILDPSYFEHPYTQDEERLRTKWKEDEAFHKLHYSDTSYNDYKSLNERSSLKEGEQEFLNLILQLIRRSGLFQNSILPPIISVGKKEFNAHFFQTEANDNAISFNQGIGAGLLRVNVLVGKIGYDLAMGKLREDDIGHLLHFIMKYGNVHYKYKGHSHSAMPEGYAELKAIATYQSMRQTMFVILHEFGHLHYRLSHMTSARTDETVDGIDRSTKHEMEFYADKFAIDLLLRDENIGYPIFEPGLINPMILSYDLWGQAILWHLLSIFEDFNNGRNGDHPDAGLRWQRIRNSFPTKILAKNDDYVSEIVSLFSTIKLTISKDIK